MDRKIHIIGVPFALGSHRRGSDLGADAIRHAGLKTILSDEQVVDLGNIVVDNTEEESVSSLKNLQAVKNTNEILAKLVDETLKQNGLPLILGGDHSIALGSIAGTSKHYQNLGVIWIDAHGDVNTSETTPSGNIHGMPLAASMGFGEESLVNIYENKVKLKTKNVVLVGVRDLDEGEVELLNRENITYYSMNEVKEKGMGKILQEIKKKFEDNKVDGVHISFDLDSLDPTVVSGVGTPVENGLTLEEAENFLGGLKQWENISSIEFVEVNPLLDNQNHTAKTTVHLIRQFLV